MKTGLTTSVVMHAALLGFGLFSLSAPKAFDVADVEALPVEIVSISCQFQQGDKKAPVSEKPAPQANANGPMSCLMRRRSVKTT